MRTINSWNKISAWIRVPIKNSLIPKAFARTAMPLVIHASETLKTAVAIALPIISAIPLGFVFMGTNVATAFMPM